MTKQEFKQLCDGILKKHGFFKTHGHYYLDLGLDILGAVFFQASDYCSAYYLNCGFGIKSEMSIPYPKLTDVHFSWRISVPDKEKRTYVPALDGCMTTMIEYEKYSPEEIEPYIEQDLTSWIIPAIKNGKDFILNREDLYAEMVREARILQKITDEPRVVFG